MNIPDDIQAKIIAFLANELSQAEKEEFEKLIDQNEELRQAIEEQKLVDSIFNEDEWNPTEFDTNDQKAKDYLKFYTETENKDFFEQLKKIDSNKDKKNKPQFKIRQLARLVTIAAAVALFGVIAPQFFTPSNQQYYSRNVNYEELPGFVEKSESDVVLNQAQSAFENGNYKEAADLFDQLNEVDKTDWTRIYHALSLAELNQTDKAIDIIEPVMNNNDSFQQKSATWYAGLIALKADDELLAQMYLNQYLAYEEPLSHKAQAQKLLKRLNK